MKTAVEPRFERIFATVPAVLLFILIAAAAPPADGAPEPEGWYAGDMHVHRSCGGSPESVTSLRTKMSANNLRVMSLLADMGNGEVQDPVTDLPLVTGWDAPESTDSRMIRWDTEWHWDATYGQFAHQALGGHIIALGLTDAQQVWEEYTYPVLEWAHQRNGIAGFAHMQYLDDGIPQSLNCCIPIEYPVEVALGAADFISEDVTGSNAAINAYYRLLNTGFRPGFAAGTDYPCGVSTLGSLLTYVQIPPGQPMTYEAWIDGIQQGRTVVSRNGHEEFLDLQVNGDATPGDEIALSGGDSIPVDVIWTATQTITGGRIELVHDGIVVASEQATVTPTTPVTLTAIVDFANSGWLAARRMDAAGEHRLQTGAVFVIVDGKPVRVSADDANFYVQWMDNLLTRTSPGGAWASYFTDEFSSDNPTCPPEGCRAAAQARYSQAKAIYQQIALEAEATPPPPPSADCAQLAALEQRIWSDSTPPPAIFSDSDTSAVELGVKFQTGVAGCITGLRFYKGGTSNTGPHVGHLWTENGQLLATATFSNESSSGWQQATLATPVSIEPGATYVASYHAPGGRYSVNDGYFGTAVDSGDLTALADGASGANGVYAYGPSGSFPTGSYLQSNYWVDVVFRSSGAAPPPPPPPPPPPADCQQLTALEQRIWSDSTPPPAIFSDSDTSAVELGVKFQTGVAGCITGLRFYKGGTSNTGPHVGHLWTENGQLLATATFSNESSSGWQQATLATPVSVDPGTTYVASYHAPGGHYSVNDGYFGTAVDSGDLTALADGASDDNGVYAYGPPGSFPTRGYLQSNYWVDVVFRANQ